MNYKAREATLKDEKAIFHLYQTVAENVGGIAREKTEITASYIKNNLEKAIQTGVSLVIEDTNSPVLIAEIHCYKLEPKVFHHILSELTVVVHPDFQGKGLGKLIFNELLNHINKNRNDIMRVELIARESNAKAIEMYGKLGFKQEGRLEKRINSNDGNFEADIPMAWFNPNFKRVSV